MRISSLPQIFRNVNRGREIVSVLSRYGLADWLSRTNVEFAKGLLKNRNGEALARHTREARIRLALGDLGPTFVKLGQLMGTRPDIVGVELADELKKLQTEAPADPPEVIRHIVEQELGQSISDLFQEFDDKPIASASIGQVHLARLISGESVVVKVQHAGIQATVLKDIDVLSGLAQLAEKLPEFALYRPVATAAEFQRTLRRELDFGREERNLQHFFDHFADDDRVHVPQVYSDLCTSKVLTMEYVDGIKLSESDRLAAEGIDLKEVARRGADIYLQMIFSDGFYHADPHPGNILLLPGNVIGLLDFGMVGRIDERLREDIEEMLIAVAGSDPSHLASVIMRVGRTPPDLDEASLRADVSEFVSLYASRSLAQFNLSKALNDLTEMIHSHNIILPAQVGLLIKVLITLEGTAQLLSPEFSLLEAIGPMRRRMILRRLSPARRIKKMRRVFMELEHLAEVLPRRVNDILEQFQTGKLDIHLQHRRLGPSINRLVLGMLASALFMGSSLMLSYKVPPVIFPNEPFLGIHHLSILGLAGCIVSVLLGLRLLLAIGKSGRLDRPE